MSFLWESSVVHRRDKIRNNSFEEKIAKIGRVSKVVKGGRRFSFASLVIIGNKNGYVGVGLGKANEVSKSREKAINSAKNNLFRICLTKAKTVPHEVSAKFCSTKVMIKPAKPGTGIIAGGAMRMIFECLGVRDVVAKIQSGSSNPHNVAKATISALMSLRSLKYYSKFHNIKINKNTTDDKIEEDDLSLVVDSNKMATSAH